MAARVFVVSDAQDLLDMFRQILEDEGYEVCLSSFPLVKASEVERFHPDIMLLDVFSGDEKISWRMLEMLKLQPSTTGIPLVVCTAPEQMTPEWEASLRNQQIQVLSLPFDLHQLLRALITALRSRTVTGRKERPSET